MSILTFEQAKAELQSFINTNTLTEDSLKDLVSRTSGAMDLNSIEEAKNPRVILWYSGWADEKNGVRTQEIVDAIGKQAKGEVANIGQSHVGKLINDPLFEEVKDELFGMDDKAIERFERGINDSDGNLRTTPGIFDIASERFGKAHNGLPVKAMVAFTDQLSVFSQTELDLFLNSDSPNINGIDRETLKAEYDAVLTTEGKAKAIEKTVDRVRRVSASDFLHLQYSKGADGKIKVGYTEHFFSSTEELRASPLPEGTQGIIKGRDVLAEADEAYIDNFVDGAKATKLIAKGAGGALAMLELGIVYSEAKAELESGDIAAAAETVAKWSAVDLAAGSAGASGAYVFAKWALRGLMFHPVGRAISILGGLGGGFASSSIAEEVWDWGKNVLNNMFGLGEEVSLDESEQFIAQTLNQAQEEETLQIDDTAWKEFLEQVGITDEEIEEGTTFQFGSGTDNQIRGDEYSNFLFGGAGNDEIDGYEGHDRLFGGAGDDNLDGDSGSDRLYGGSGDDRIDGGTGSDVLYGGPGNDWLSDSDSSNVLYGEGGNDRLSTNGGFNQLFGDAGIDDIDAGGGFNRLYGGSDNDDLDAYDGNNILYGEEGDDNLFANGGSNQLFGGLGSDRFDASGGNNILYGGEGDDQLDAWGNNNQLYGGLGDEKLSEVYGDNNVFYGEEGHDRFYTSGNFNTLYGGVDNDDLDADGDNNVLYGEEGNDDLYAWGDNNQLYGGSGHDELDVSGGDNYLNGGTGNDTLKGGEGINTYSFVPGDGEDEIRGSSNITEDDTIVINTNVDNIRLLREEFRNGLSIYYGQNDQILIWSHFDGEEGYSYPVKTLQLNDATINLIQGLILTGDEQDNSVEGTINDDTLRGGTGNDTLEGDLGDDLYIFTSGDGKDEIQEYTSETEENSIIIDAELNNIRLLREEDSDDLYIYYGKNDRIFIDGHFDDEGDNSYPLKTLHLNDETIDLTQGLSFTGNARGNSIAGTIYDDQLRGRAGDDVLLGGAGNDILRGGAQDDLLIGGYGGDKLYGNAGNDTLIGFGNSWISPDLNERDVLRGNEGADLFVLGDVYRDYGTTIADGNRSRAVIADFEIGFDYIQINGNPSDYQLIESIGGHTKIFYKAEDMPKDLIGIVRNTGGLDLSDASVFQFAW